MNRVGRQVRTTAVFMCIFVCVFLPQGLFSGPTAEPDKEGEIEMLKHPIIEGVYVIGPDEWEGYTIVYRELDHKEAALAALGSKNLRIIVNLDIHAKNSDGTKAVHDLDTMPEITVFFELAPSQSKLHFWESDAGWTEINDYIDNDKYPGTEITDYSSKEKSEEIVEISFKIVQWPKEDKDTAGG